MPEPARIVALPTAAQPEAQKTPEMREDEFLRMEDLTPLAADTAKRAHRAARAELAELFRGSRWEDLLALFHPVDAKNPELVAAGLDADVRGKVAFALGQLKRFDEAIAELKICLEREPESFFHHSSLAYTAYNSLWAAKNREVFLAGKIRGERIELAHEHFRAAQALRPDGVTNFFRQGMLLRKLENKNDKALPLFKTAVQNWETLDEGQRQARHQEHKNYVKSLFQLASSLLEAGKARPALDLVRRCLAEDEQSGHLSPLHKHFALGKVHFHLNQFAEAREALHFAARQGAERPTDFVQELLARTLLSLNEPRQALEAIGRIPEKVRKPYLRWTEADILCALREFPRARAALLQAAERDPLGRHKALIRLAKLEYLGGDFEKAVDSAAKACRFYEEKYGNPCHDGLFWQSAGAYRLGQADKALRLARQLQECDPGYPRLERLLKAAASST